MMTLSDAIARMQNQLRIRDEVKNYPPEDLLMFLDDVMPQVLAQACQYDPDRFVVRKLKSELDPGVSQLDANKWRMRFEEPILYVRRFVRTDSNLPIPLAYVDPSQKFSFWAHFAPIGPPGAWSIVGEREVLMNQDPNGVDFEVQYIPKVPRLMSFTTSKVGAAGELFCNVKNPVRGTINSRKGGYSGVVLKVTSASGAAPESEFATVSNSQLTTYPELKFSLETNLTVPAPAGSTVEMTLPFKDHGDDLLILEAVTRVLTSEGNEKRQMMVRGIKGESHQVHSQTSRMQQDSPRYINYIPRG